MLFFFDKGLNAATATREICDVYPNALTSFACRKWFQKFRNGDCSLFKIFLGLVDLVF